MQIYIMPPPPPPSRTPSVQDPASLGLGTRAGVYDYDTDSISGEGVPKFFRNIGRAFTHTWNEKPTAQQKQVLAPMLGAMKTITKAVAPEASPLIDMSIGGLQKKYGVGLFAGAPSPSPMGRGLYAGAPTPPPMPMGRGMCMGDRKVKQYIKRA